MKTRYALPTALAMLALTASAQLAVGPRKPALAMPLKGKITVDGRLDEAAWQTAPEQTGFEKVGLRKREKIPANVQTSFRVLYDAATLYVGIHCREPKMDQLTVKAADVHDAAMWSDDDVELFIDPVGDRNEYYQFAINSRGTQVDLYMIEHGNTGKSYSAAWQAATFHGKIFWDVEIALPFAALFERPAETWSDTWVFSISRTRTPTPRYFSQFSPGNKYHDIDNFGTLGPIRIDRTQFNLFAESPSFRLSPRDGGFGVTGTFSVENRGSKPVTGTARMTILSEKPAASEVPVSCAPGASVQLAFADVTVEKQGKYPILLEVRATDGMPVLAARFDEWLRYVPLQVKLTVPSYRNSIFPTQNISTVKGVLHADLPIESIRGRTGRVSIAGPLTLPRVFETAIKAADTPFEIGVDHLPVGDYVLRAEILKVTKRGRQSQEEVVAETEAPFRKLPRAAMEARVSRDGNLLIDGTPIFIRGWYGSMNYVRSAAAFPEAQLPRTTNFIMGCTRDTCAETGLYTLRGVTRLIDERKAKLDQPIDGALKAKLRAAVASVRNDRYVIGYYISDEPECRGLSPYYLRTLYDFLKREDPYRIILIVSRAPEKYIAACDVICPHPYLNPQQYVDGTRKFANYILGIRNVMRKAVAANDGSKLVWCMPQTFSYGGPTDTHPNFFESRWFTFTALANGAKGIVPFIFNGYWNHLENRLAMDAVFEDLAFLAPAWKNPGTDAVVTVDNPLVDAVAKQYRPENAPRANVYIVTANQSYGENDAAFDVPALRENKVVRLLVLRENRVVPVENGRFRDHFGRLGVHVYTTLEVLPDLKPLEAIQADIDRRLALPRKQGNLLAQPDIAWRVLGREGIFSRNEGLADGVTLAGGWLPVYGDRSKCQLEFDRPVTFSRVVLYTPSIRDADLQVLKNGKWETIHQWRDRFLQRLEYKGSAITTTGVRIVPRKARMGVRGPALNEITELGLYP